MSIKQSDYYKSGRFIDNAKKSSKLGSIRLSEIKMERIENYNKNPKLCFQCESPIIYEKRNNKFCSSSCSATHNNTLRKESKKCENCGNEFVPNRRSKKYCCRECSLVKLSERAKIPWEDQDYRDKVSNGLKKAWAEKRDNFSTGEKHSKIVGETTKGKYKGKINSIFDVSKRTSSKIIRRLNLSCCICGWKEGTCDIHHINGKKVENYNDHSNLTYVCPNCHRLLHENKIDKNKLKTLKEILPDNWMDLYYG